jgi:hypothetical protein
MRECSAKPDHPKSFSWRLRSAWFKKFITNQESADISIVADKLGSQLALRLLWAIRSRSAKLAALRKAEQPKPH